MYDAHYYIYINGDIIISLNSLNFFNSNYNRFYNKRIYITSDRHNIYLNDFKYYNKSKHYEIYKKGKQYTRCGQDTFITMKNTFNENQMIILRSLAIGRIKIDNIILGMAVKDNNIITVDLSDIIQAIHISATNRLLFKIKKVDYYWNVNYISSLISNRIACSCLDRIECFYNSTLNKYMGNKICNSLN